MKNSLLIFAISLLSTCYAQKDVNVQRSYGARGYDLVMYQSNVAKKGKRKFIALHQGVKYKFTSETTKTKFLANPMKYLPKYGGWCAYAMALNGSKVKINPKTFQIHNGELYLFYNAFFNNTLEIWIEDGEDLMRKKADEEWEKVISL